MKICSKCKIEKDSSSYRGLSSAKDGLQKYCKTCQNDYIRKYLKDNPDKKKKYCSRDREKDPGGNTRRGKKWKSRNREKHNALNREYSKKNREKCAAKYARYFCSKISAIPAWLTKNDRDQINQIYSEAKKITDKTGIKHEVDHIVPLQGKDVRGLHVPWNLRIITAKENRSKGSRMTES